MVYKYILKGAFSARRAACAGCCRTPQPRNADERQVEVMGPDPWAYDPEGSRTAVRTLLRYAAEQGIVREPPAPEEPFAATALDEPPAYGRR